MNDTHNKKAWVVAVDMGYGHQRASYPLKRIAFGGKVINANKYDGIPEDDQEISITIDETAMNDLLEMINEMAGILSYVGITQAQTLQVFMSPYFM